MFIAHPRPHHCGVFFVHCSSLQQLWLPLELSLRQEPSVSNKEQRPPLFAVALAKAEARRLFQARRSGSVRRRTGSRHGEWSTLPTDRRLNFLSYSLNGPS